MEGGRFVGMQLPCHDMLSAVSQGEEAGLGFNSSQSTRGEPVSCVT